MMQATPKASRLTIALVGRANVGKSTLLNRIAGQDVAIVSPVAGTTTDVVEKAMELLPFGPILWLDTGGWNDRSFLGSARKARTEAALARADLVFGVVADDGQAPDPDLLALAQKREKPLLILVTQCDRCPPSEAFLQTWAAVGAQVVRVEGSRSDFLNTLKPAMTKLLPRHFVSPPEPLDGIVPPGGTVLPRIPSGSGAPEGRILLRQVNALRDALDRDYLSVVVTENRIREAVERFRPDLAICDSQVVRRMIDELPSDLPATTYSILMARLKGDLPALAAGAAAIRHLQDGDRILIGEACTHHAAEDDIGRVKIPRWIREKTGKELTFEVVSGKDFPKELSQYALVIHCGGCMINRAFMLWRMDQAKAAGVPITNYGVAISETQGVLDRVLQPFGITL